MDHRTELRTLTALARLGNARRAADAVGLSQSTVSDLIARLERTYGTRLFDRGRHGSRPTATGALVIEAARQSLEILDNAEREVGLLEGYERGALSVAAHPLLIESHLTPAVATMLGHSANLHCRIRSATPDALLRGLRDRHLELFIGLAPDAPHDDVTIEAIATYEPVPFCRSGHPLATVPPQGIQVLREFPIVTTEAPRWYTSLTGAAMPTDPVLADEIAERGRHVIVDHLATMETLVLSTDALGLAPLQSIRRGIEAGGLVMLDVPDDQQAILQSAPIVLATMDERPLPPSATALIDIIRTTPPDVDRPGRAS
ncbi:LysR family transcriptional regulator [Candidatus Neomicrothrix sp.]|uniref:LysR family transcriptional regulator n=1 Tax=Candidatus Neomicrothrix sp. TaxID=2719034 RepID=UPI002B7D758F|nr:LysR family transcriptional regulator [Candidatus Microthrix sp.]HMS49745.1 LysR family transcriptional regulator [Candidatus Microthrix sp.]HMT26396.1 LysR family transcriptional regulator [Microthrixaceae bacterium]